MERLVAQLKSTQEQIKSLQDQMDDEEIDPSLLEPVTSIQEKCNDEEMGNSGESKGSSPVELPPGWRSVKRNSAKQKTKYETVLRSPEGTHFYSFLSAVQFMVKNRRRHPEAQVEIMKRNLRHEGWRQEKFLPKDWQLCEKQTPDGSSLTGFRYLSDKMRYFESTSAVLAFMRTNRYSQSQIDHFRSEMSSRENSKKVPKKTNKATTSKKDLTVCRSAKKIVDKKETPNNVPVLKLTEADIIIVEDEESHDEKSKMTGGGGEWERNSESLPPGWERRVGGTTKMEFIKSPDGVQYKSRFVALQDLAAKSAPQEILDDLRRKMVEHENWEESSLLPEGWLFKVIWEGTGGKDGRWNSNLRYLSREGVAFDSMKEVVAHLQLYHQSSPSLGQENIQNCHEFLRVRSQQNIQQRHNWQDSQSIPPGWKMRRAESQGKKPTEFFLSPHNTQYKSRFSAVQDMMVRADLYTGEEVELMKEKLISEESWQVSSLLPPGWLYKVVWEGQNKNNIWLLSGEGFYFESMKAAREYIRMVEGYQEADDERCQQFLDQQRKLKSKARSDWEEGGESLPEGWCRRTAEGKAGMEFILSPQGEQFKSRFSGLMWLYRSQADPAQIQEMREKLSFEGWQSSDLLPEGWLYRRAFEGYGKNGSQISTTLYLSREGECYDSVRTATEFLASCEGEGYYQQHQDNLKKLHKMLGAAFTKTRSDWVEDEKTLPRLWKRRKCGKVEFFLRPDGRQFKSRLSGLQAMIREKYPAREINQMRSQLCHEGWSSHKLLPRHWFYKKSLTTWNKRKVMDYSFLSAEGPQFSSLRSARQFLVKTGSYSAKSINNWDSFVRDEAKISRENTHDWSAADCLPRGWKSRTGGGGEGRRYYLSPGGQQFLSLLTAYQHLLSQGQPPASLRQARASLASEGWQDCDQLPAGWLRIARQTSASHSYLDNRGNTFLNAKKALEAVEEDPSYSPEERSLLRKIVEAGEVSLDEKYKWSSYPELPPGWKVRRKVSRSRKMIEFYLAPDGKHIRGRTSAVQHLISLGGQDSQISKLKNFSWFKIRKNRESLDNTLEELVSEESDISLSSSFNSNASDMSALCEDEKSSEVEQCQEYSGSDILDKLKHLQKLVKQGEQSEAQQTLLEIENSVTLNNKRRKQ